MDKILRILFNFKEFKPSHDDDLTDRLTRSYTSTVLFVFCLIITSSHYVGHVIECWCPAQFTDSHKRYANTICWVSNTYYVPMDNQIPLGEQLDYVNYYQWVPFILLCQGLLCYIPRIAWKFLSKRSGINLSHIMDAAIAGERTSYNDMREKTCRYVVFQMDRYLRTRRPRPRDLLGKIKMAASKYCCLLCTQIKGSYLVLVYLFAKCLYLANAVGQLFLLDIFLGRDFRFYGIEIMYRLLMGREWSNSVRFPRVTLCNFEIRHQTQLHKYIVQCALPINIFNEKLFIFIWFWFVMLSILTAYSLLWWTCHLLYPRSNYNFVKSNLVYSHPEVPKRQKQNLVKFTEFYLQKDGLFIVRLLAQTAGVMSAADVICGLWENYGPEKRNSAEGGGSGGLNPSSMRTPSSRSPSYSNFRDTPSIRITREEV